MFRLSIEYLKINRDGMQPEPYKENVFTFQTESGQNKSSISLTTKVDFLKKTFRQQLQFWASDRKVGSSVSLSDFSPSSWLLSWAAFQIENPDYTFRSAY